MLGGCPQKWVKFEGVSEIVPKKKNTLKFAALMGHVNGNVHLGYQQGFIWRFNKFSFEFSTKLMFDFWHNKPK
jgi:hypothetical protein